MNGFNRWYEGTPPPPSVAHTRQAVFLVVHAPQRHWTARATRRLLTFCRRHWEWGTTVLLALVGLWLGVRASP